MASIFGRDFVRAYNPAFQQGMAAESDRQRAIQQDMLLRQRMEAERERALIDALTRAGGSPVMSPDGKLDVLGSNRALGEAERGAEIDRYKKQIAARNQAETEATARAYGIDPSRQQKPAGWSLSPGTVNQTVPLEQAVREREEAARLAAYERERNATADAQIRANEAKESMSLKTLKAEAEARGIDINSPDGKDWLSFNLELARVPNDAKYAKLTVRDMVKAGLVKKDRDAIEREEARIMQFGGKLPPLSAAMEKSIADESNLVLNLGSVQKAIAGFEQKYGHGSFDRYAGPIDSRTNEWKLNISKDAATQADLDAQRIAQMFTAVYNADLKATSGGAVTESEAVRKLREAGSLNGANFKNTLQGWRDARITGLKNKEKVLESYAVPPGLFNYGEAGDAGQAAVDPQPGQPAKRVRVKLSDLQN